MQEERALTVSNNMRETSGKWVLWFITVQNRREFRNPVFLVQITASETQTNRKVLESLPYTVYTHVLNYSFWRTEPVSSICFSHAQYRADTKYIQNRPLVRQ